MSQSGGRSWLGRSGRNAAHYVQGREGSPQGRAENDEVLGPPTGPAAAGVAQLGGPLVAGAEGLLNVLCVECCVFETPIDYNRL